MRLSSICFLTLLSLAPLPLLQNPQPKKPLPQERDPGKPTPSASERKSIQEKVEQMQGLWRIRELTTPKRPVERRVETGYVLISGQAFSMELHMGYVAPDQKTILGRELQSGIHRFEIDDAGFMETKTVIGSLFNSMGGLQFEPPNHSRRFEVKIGQDDMRWSNSEGTIFDMEKVLEPKYVERDVFGRPVPGKKPEEPKEPR